MRIEIHAISRVAEPEDVGQRQNSTATEEKYNNSRIPGVWVCGNRINNNKAIPVHEEKWFSGYVFAERRGLSVRRGTPGGRRIIRNRIRNLEPKCNRLSALAR